MKFIEPIIENDMMTCQCGEIDVLFIPCANDNDIWTFENLAEPEGNANVLSKLTARSHPPYKVSAHDRGSTVPFLRRLRSLFRREK